MGSLNDLLLLSKLNGYLKKFLEDISVIFSKADKDNSGTLTVKEFQDALDDICERYPQMQLYLKNKQMSNLVDILKESKGDVEKEAVALNIEEFKLALKVDFQMKNLPATAEAQACEYKQKFKALEVMAEQVKSEGFSSTNSISSAPPSTNSSSNKLERTGSRPRGSGSPFKCIGLGFVHQMKSERDDDEFAAGRLRIEELEALAASRQKEIFMLNTRLATAESITHDVLRDLLGLKSDMTGYASLLDNQQVEKITEKAQLHNTGVQNQMLFTLSCSLPMF
ncbi:hypothetical protein POM88_013567 [Heracleum sosnowskyi]|uniref:EF-hand domain-containing protein n=1 Tax=Heracleum sosnowskyi TaxID=360622 RepID=A0AAD8J1B3_9APIA|nr:hypothetical protein POM88_013567 [Heracleum sosnowskyi]